MCFLSRQTSEWVTFKRHPEGRQTNAQPFNTNYSRKKKSEWRSAVRRRCTALPFHLGWDWIPIMWRTSKLFFFHCVTWLKSTLSFHLTSEKHQATNASTWSVSLWAEISAFMYMRSSKLLSIDQTKWWLRAQRIIYSSLQTSGSATVLLKCLFEIEINRIYLLNFWIFIILLNRQILSIRKSLNEWKSM